MSFLSVVRIATILLKARVLLGRLGKIICINLYNQNYLNKVTSPISKLIITHFRLNCTLLYAIGVAGHSFIQKVCVHFLLRYPACASSARVL